MCNSSKLCLKFTTIYITLLISLQLWTTEGCHFKTKPYDKRPAELGASFSKNYTRKINSIKPCVCGGDNTTIEENEKPWILYIHVKLEPLDNIPRSRLCVGTIVNSNMVITSHRCFMKTDKMFVYDAWLKKPENLVDITDVTISTKPNLTEPGSETFKIKKIIYRSIYAFDKFFGISTPETDVATLIIEYNFNFYSHSKPLAPICVPKYNQIPTSSLYNRDAVYQGIRGWDQYKIKFPTFIKKHAEIYSAEDCNTQGKLNLNVKNDTLCVRFVKAGPSIEGGSLRITSTRFREGGDHRAFLVGIASLVQHSLKNENHKYAFFTNINSIVKHLEEQAAIYDSEWCTTPTFFDDEWPWETFTGEYDQSLDCDCGIKPNLAKSRIINGTDTEPNEFPWLVQLFIAGNAFCGASIINDRMILTAAHCVADHVLIEKGTGNDILFYQGDLSKFKISLHNHKILDDPNAYIVHAKQIVFHPGYAPSRYYANSFDFDIAIIILNDTISGNLTSKDSYGNYKLGQICLPRKGDVDKLISKNALVTQAGWGMVTANNSNIPDRHNTSVVIGGVTYRIPYAAVTQKLEMPIHDILRCTQLNAAFGQLSSPPTDTKICAGNFTILQSTFSGDSGSPLIGEVSNKGRWAQLGLVSYKPIIENVEQQNYNTTVFFLNVEVFLDYIGFYAEQSGAKGCRQLK